VTASRFLADVTMVLPRLEPLTQISGSCQGAEREGRDKREKH
jgi:hypothetical protein